MATIGQQLLVPELGWKKYDDRNTLLTFTNDDRINASTDSTNTSGVGLTLKFLLYGTKFRIIGHNYMSGTVAIDGISYNMTTQGGNNFDTLMFEKLNLPLGTHKIEFVADTGWITAIHVGIDDYIMKYRSIGTQLLTADSGWQRIDDIDSKIKYTGTWARYLDPHYNGSLNESNIYGDTIKFKFYGTMLRIIYAKAPNRDSNIIITIDGVQYNYNPYNATLLYQIIVFEKIGLDLKVHDVIITKGTNSSTYFGLDAIDIDDIGYLTNYIYYLIKHDSSYYSIKSNNYDSEIKTFIPLVLQGISSPNTEDIEANGFTDISKLTTDLTIESETFKPIDKLYNNFEIKEYYLK